MEQFLDEDGRLILNNAETKTQADLDRVIGLGKSQRVIDLFEVMVDRGNNWAYCLDYIYYLNDLDTWEKWEAQDIVDPDGNITGTTEKPAKPLEPIRVVRQAIPYSVLRKQAYPDITDFADAFVKAQAGDNTTMQEYVARCLAVKEKYPKGE